MVLYLGDFILSVSCSFIHIHYSCSINTAGTIKLMQVSLMYFLNQCNTYLLHHMVVDHRWYHWTSIFGRFRDKKKNNNWEPFGSRRTRLLWVNWADSSDSLKRVGIPVTSKQGLAAEADRVTLVGWRDQCGGGASEKGQALGLVGVLRTLGFSWKVLTRIS